MNKRELEKYGKSLIGKSAQSRFLTGLDRKGDKIYLPAQIITGYELTEWFGEPVLMVTIGGESVFEDSLFNIQ